MVNLFTENAFSEIVTGLHSLYYSDKALLGENYGFSDWFTDKKEERKIAAAVFGQTPMSYETACVGVAVSNNGNGNGKALVDKLRALGAPIILEVDNREIREWAVSRKENDHALIGQYPIDSIKQMFVSRTPDWRPESLMRAKNIGKFHSSLQLGLFAGLLPELEGRIQASLEPILEYTLENTVRVYFESTRRNANSAHLFKLIFWILTAKVFYDRRVNGFASLSADADEILGAIAEQYQEPLPKLLNKEAREVAVSHIWNELDFRNLSVEVLAQMWSRMLIDKDTRKRFGIHRTSRTIVQYMVEKIPFDQSGDDPRIIFEPCSGSAVFLIGAMNKLRPKLFGMSPAERHEYFIKHFAGVEQDFFGVEISRLALTLADFPNLGGWNIAQGDVYKDGVLTKYLQQSAVVLCNPPFEKFDEGIRNQYNLTSPWKPVELLHRVLDDLHPSGVIGFVLPRNIVDGRGYKELRRRLAERFAEIDITVIPDRAFDASTEAGLLVATEPIPHNHSRIVFSKVNDSEVDWKKFELRHEVSGEPHIVELNPAEAAEKIAVPDLPNVWDYLIGYPRLGDVAELHRGLDWNIAYRKPGNKDKLIRNTPAEGFMLGVAPSTKFSLFEAPVTYYLNVQEKYQRRNPYKLPWHKPKVIFNAIARARGRWRIAAFPDSQGLTCYDSFTGAWSKSPKFDEVILSAVLNSPVANAFVATREGRRHITIETLKMIPVPHFTSEQALKLKALVTKYQEATQFTGLLRKSNDDPESLLMEIDALVLDGYRMPARLERELLDYFNGHGSKRRVLSHSFRDYFPAEMEAYFSLSDYLSPEFQKGTFGDLVKHLEARKR